MELDEPCKSRQRISYNLVGKNDGSVQGVTYFQCKPLHGVFAPPGKITFLPEIFGLGDRVYVGSQERSGVIRFIGATQFAAGEWIGIELDLPCNSSTFNTNLQWGKMTGRCMGIDTSVVRKNTECSLRTLKSHWCLASTQHLLRHLSSVWFLSMLSQLLMNAHLSSLFFLRQLPALPPRFREKEAFRERPSRSFLPDPVRRSRPPAPRHFSGRCLLWRASIPI